MVEIYSSVMKFPQNQVLLEVPQNFSGTGKTYGTKFCRLPYLVLPHSRRPALFCRNKNDTSSISSQRHRHVIKLRNHGFGLQTFGYKFRLSSTSKVPIPRNFITVIYRFSLQIPAARTFVKEEEYFDPTQKIGDERRYRFSLQILTANSLTTARPTCKILYYLAIVLFSYLFGYKK